MPPQAPPLTRRVVPGSLDLGRLLWAGPFGHLIRSLLRATLVRFGKKMEGMFPEDDQLVADRILAE